MAIAVMIDLSVCHTLLLYQNEPELQTLRLLHQSNCLPLSRHISEMVQDGTKMAIDHK